jgi:hypothetical protein
MESNLDKYMTGKKVPLKLVLHTNAGKQMIDALGNEHQAGLGELMLRLIELAELRREKSTWLHRFLNGRFETLVIDMEIKEICNALDEAKVNWVKYR